jgi:hypothetical protein
VESLNEVSASLKKKKTKKQTKQTNKNTTFSSKVVLGE